MLTSCLFDHPSKSDKIGKDYILEINEIDLIDFDSINLLLKNNKNKLVPKLKKENPVSFGEITNHYFTKVLLNKYLPDSTTNRGFLIRQNYSMNPERKLITKPKLSLFYLHYNFDKNKATYTLCNSKLIRGERHPEIHEKNFNYSIHQKLLFNYNLDSILSRRNNLLYTNKITNNWIYIIDYEKVGNDDYFKPKEGETDILKEKYFNFVE